MDNSWQMKCSSMWQPVMSSIASSPQLQPPELRTQVWNVGHYFHPLISRDSSSTAGEMLVTESTKISDFHNSSHADPGSSFLSLLSGPQSLPQCDLQQFSSSMPFFTSSKGPVTPLSSNSLAFSAAGSGVPLGCTGFSQNLSSQNQRTRADHFPVVPSRAEANASYGSGLSLLDILHATNLNHQSSQPAKAVIDHSDASHERVWNFSSAHGKWVSSRNSTNAGKPIELSTRASQKASLETNSPISSGSSTPASGCPRVFCLGASGDLLLSNTGLLGVVCSCHGFHMSISKFSVHSGLTDVHPGDAVHMESGETIAQWRNVYFHKFGITVPEDQSGWDWPEGISTTAGMVKRRVTTSNMPKTSDLSNLAGSFGGLVGFGQPQRYVPLFKNPNTGQKLTEVSYSGTPRYAQDSCNSLHKGFIGASQSNSPAIGNNQILECPMSSYLTKTNSVGVTGSDNHCQSISAYIESISKRRLSFISHQNLLSANDSDPTRFYNLKKDNIMDRDVVSASIELRLGQPSPQSHTLQSPALTAFGSHQFDKHGDTCKSLVPEQLIHNSISRTMEEENQYFQQAGPSNSFLRRGQNQLNFVNHAPGINYVRDASVMETGDTHSKTPIDGWMHSKINSGVAGGCHITMCDSTNSPWSRSNVAESQQIVHKLGLQKHVDKGEVVPFAADGQRVATEPSFLFHTKHMETSTKRNGVGGHRSCLAEHGKSSHPCQFSEMPPNACDTSNPSNQSGKITCRGLNGHLDCDFLRSRLQMDVVPVGSSVRAPTYASNKSAAFTNKEGTGVSSYLLDDNLGMLAFRHMVELSTQGCADASLGINQDLGRLKNSYGEKELGSVAYPTSSKEQSHLALASKQVASEVAKKPLQSGFTCWRGSDVEKLAPSAGLNKWCSFSTSSPGTSLQSRSIEKMQCQLSGDRPPNEQPLWRSRRVENDSIPSNDCGNCGHRVPWPYIPIMCGCNVQRLQTSSRQGNCDSNGETFVSTSIPKEWSGSPNGMASMFLAPKSNGNSIFVKEKALSSDQIGNLESRVKKKVDFHAFQWRDVPSKVSEVCNLTSKDRPVDLLNREEMIGDQLADAAQCFNRCAQDVESSKDREISMVSSGCSAAAVTQASVGFNNLDSSTGGSVDGYSNNIVGDQGSGIDKCWSSDDPPDSERSSELFGFACKIHSANEGSSNPLPNQSSRSLIDELRLRDSLIPKNVKNDTDSGFSILGKANQVQKFEGSFKSAKETIPKKRKTLGAPFSASGTGCGHLHSRSAKEKQMLQPGQERVYNCACSLGPSSKKNSVMCFNKTFSGKRELRDRIQLRDEDDCLGIPENSCRKRFRPVHPIPPIKQRQMQEPNCTGTLAKFNSTDCMATSSTEAVGVCKSKARAVVCGKYGVICNGDSSGPAKIGRVRGEENDPIQLVVENGLGTPVICGRNRFRAGQTVPPTKQLLRQEPKCTDTGILPKLNSPDCMSTSSSERGGVSKGKARPVVCGKYGAISNGDSSRPEKNRLDREEGDDWIPLRVDDDCLGALENRGRKRFRSGQTGLPTKQLRIQEPISAATGKFVKFNLTACMITSSAERVGVCKGKTRPVVCGKYGVISDGDSPRPAKFISLRKILKIARRCTLSEKDQLTLNAGKKSKKGNIGETNGCINRFSNTIEGNSEGDDDMVSGGMDPYNPVKETEATYSPSSKECDDIPYDDERENSNRILGNSHSTQLKPKCKEIRERSLYELSIKGGNSSCADISSIKSSKCFRHTKCGYLSKFLKNAEDDKCHEGGLCNAKSTEERQFQSSISHLNAFCCVCGGSSRDEINYLLECSRCLIRVHQACYGVSKVPRGHWCCRPCRTSSKNIVCVLCGYGGGAMTQALRSRSIVKSLLKAWNFFTKSGSAETSPFNGLEDGVGMLSFSTSGLQRDPFTVTRLAEPSSAISWSMDLQKQLDCVKSSACSSSNSEVHNSITAGVLDSTVKQWVHMVCGLWTPGTRCPNVDTMSAFDVSGASPPEANLACSMCNRPGGSCIQCRVRDCSVKFHPWCAHQKGLLQSEVEGANRENVGFYGRCMLHPAYRPCDSHDSPIVSETGHPGEREYTCARTEGYKGRKREGFGIRCNLPYHANRSNTSGCVVPQEQLDAWLHINRQKSRPKGLPKLPISDVEYDFRKEYARYKQSKGWKHLVVYKSGIHALGLYTSQFISHGAMVVEYVGEIVGLRVADKREIDYQFGRKLQYKSACYFFRVDKEHIIDATRKGGIARFVNHSCLPNCVARVISVRNEKKVVFFAQRDIFPGEEITYDYHFNHEDEGQKIPCFCNSKNCRRYLN